MADDKITLYYHAGFLGRGGAAQRMFKIAGVEYQMEHDFGELAKICGAFGSPSPGGFAPPALKAKGKTVFQSAAVAMFAGELAGFDKGVDAAEAVSFINTVADFQTESGKAKEDATALKEFIKGKDGAPASRQKLFLTTMEAMLKGKHAFGDELTYPDFVWASLVDWNTGCIYGPIAEKEGKDRLSWLDDYPKLKATYEAIHGHPKLADLHKELALSVERFHIKDAVRDAYLA